MDRGKMLAVEDKRLFCERCQLYFSESCPAHGPPHFIKDSAVLEGAGDRAVLSLPQCLGWIFGPYEGEGLLSRKACTKYSWAIKDKGFFFYVDASDESKANWMRYVACASSEGEQNLTVFQYHGRIYYRISKAVPPGAELRVWIGREYATMLGLQLGDHIKFEFGEKETLMKTFQDIQVVSVGNSSQQPDGPPLAIGEVYSEAASEDRRSPQGQGTPTVSSSIPPSSPLPPPPPPDSSLNPARPTLKFNFVKGSESLVSLSRAQSRYWTFFGFEANRFGQFLDKTKIICKLCGGRLAYSGNTTNLRQHLIYKHRHEFNQLMDSGIVGPIQGPSPAATFTPAGPQRGGQRLSQPPAPPGSLAAPRMPRGGDGNAKVSSSVTNKAPPALPAPPAVTATVEGEGFRQLISTMLPSYQLPSAQFLAQEVLGGAYQQGRAKWAGLLRDAVRGAVTSEKPAVVALSLDDPIQDSDSSSVVSALEEGCSVAPPGPVEGAARCRVAVSGEVWWHGWRGGASYVTVSAHFVDEDFRQHSLTLSSRQLGEASVEARVREMAREWGVATPSFILLGGREGNVSALYPNFTPNSATSEQSSNLPPENGARASPPRPESPSHPPPPPHPSPSWPPVSCALGVLRECMQRILQLPDVSRTLTRCQALLSKLLPFIPNPALSNPRPAPSPAPPPGVAELLTDPALKSLLKSWGQDGLCWSTLYSGVQTLSDAQHTFSRILREMAASSSSVNSELQPDASAAHEPANAIGCLPPAGLPEPCDWSLLGELCGVLKPLDVACSTLAREQFPRLSLVKPVLTSLLSRHFAPCPGDSPFRQEAKRAVRESLAGRYSDPELNRALNLACALDPRFRGLEFVEVGERTKTLGWLKEEVVGLAQEGGGGEQDGGNKRPHKRSSGSVRDTRTGGKRARPAGEAEPEKSSDQPGSASREQQDPGATIVLDDDEDEGEWKPEKEAQTPAPAPKEKGLSDMEFLLGGLCPARPQTPQRSLAQQVERELAIFWAEPGVELGEEPLQWWRERAGQLPLLARAARVYLAAPATAGHAPCLLAQSIGEGGATFHKRANVPPDVLDQLLFLHHNRLSVTVNQSAANAVTVNQSAANAGDR
ncbi:hypothetical protein SKAU_G00320080 [Synaphobranchus kaupii]|uniref:Uncharacterized protein n=1 Tax=Synaphobranchus kaupii TaxID=118154 RepID=A0A9Q1ENH4_SYNKA|nr:hypothetical protein SKAU_G00320080 [Synaphobranchus kaupii]